MNSDEINKCKALLGQAALWVGGQIAGQVDVIDWRLSYGRVDLLVRDARGREVWVWSESVKPLATQG